MDLDTLYPTGEYRNASHCSEKDKAQLCVAACWRPVDRVESVSLVRGYAAGVLGFEVRRIRD